MVELKKIFRQADGSDIVVNAHRINEGKQIRLNNKSRDFFLLERNDINVIYKHMIQLIQEKLPPYVQASPHDIQVLTPMRKGGLGCETLNGILQRYLNPPDSRKKEHVSGDTITPYIQFTKSVERIKLIIQLTAMFHPLAVIMSALI